jgi:hypothetical protein
MDDSSFDNVDDRVLTRRSDLLLCSACLRAGFKTAVMQVISPRHRLRQLCHACFESKMREAGQNKKNGPPGPLFFSRNGR